MHIALPAHFYRCIAHSLLSMHIIHALRLLPCSLIFQRGGKTHSHCCHIQIAQKTYWNCSMLSSPSRSIRRKTLSVPQDFLRKNDVSFMTALPCASEPNRWPLEKIKTRSSSDMSTTDHSWPLAPDEFLPLDLSHVLCFSFFWWPHHDEEHVPIFGISRRCRQNCGTSKIFCGLPRHRHPPTTRVTTLRKLDTMHPSRKWTTFTTNRSTTFPQNKIGSTMFKIH